MQDLTVYVCVNACYHVGRYWKPAERYYASKGEKVPHHFIIPQTYPDVAADIVNTLNADQVKKLEDVIEAEGGAVPKAASKSLAQKRQHPSVEKASPKEGDKIVEPQLTSGEFNCELCKTERPFGTKQALIQHMKFKHPKAAEMATPPAGGSNA